MRLWCTLMNKKCVNRCPRAAKARVRIRASALEQGGGGRLVCLLSLQLCLDPLDFCRERSDALVQFGNGQSFSGPSPTVIALGGFRLQVVPVHDALPMRSSSSKIAPWRQRPAPEHTSLT